MNPRQLQQMLGQAQKQMAKIQEELGQEILEGQAGSYVTARVNGHRELQSMTSAREVVDPDDLETLQDLIVAAINDANKKAQELAEKRMGALTGGLKMPGLFSAMNPGFDNHILVEPVARLIEEFSRLPGIGPKTASRLTFYLLRSSTEQAQALANALQNLKENVRFCSRCFNITVDDPCLICTSTTRDQRMVCVVEEPLDVLAIERTSMYRGVYHVLHGRIAPLEGMNREDIRLDELLVRVRSEPIEEVILATNPNLEGENTAFYIQRMLVPSGVKITRLARGLPTGGDLEWADPGTLGSALEGRREL